MQFDKGKAARPRPVDTLRGNFHRADDLGRELLSERA
jgi:hypothetical protein